MAESQGKDLDEAYTYNPDRELQGLTRGLLNTATDTIFGSTVNFTQGWTPDGSGNWSEFTQSGGGASINQDRQVNAENQIQNYNNSSGQSTSNWTVPVYDAAGNMTTMPQPGNETNALTCTYDAWGRLATANNGTTTVSYAYDI